MRLSRRLCTLALTGVLALSVTGVAVADPGNGCTVSGRALPGEQIPGQYTSFVAQNIGLSGAINPGTAKHPSPPFVARQCNPTDNPSPPNPQL